MFSFVLSEAKIVYLGIIFSEAKIVYLGFFDLVSVLTICVNLLFSMYNAL
jgi:hypothetical protein